MSASLPSLASLKPLYTHCREIDLAASTQADIPSLLLMEHAGLAVAHIARATYPNGTHWIIVCGMGNNSGDGFVSARILSRLPGVRITVLLVGDPECLPPDAQANWHRLAWESSVHAVAKARLEDWACDLFNASGLIDALLGSGLNRAVVGDLAEWIQVINRRKGQGVIAIDLPSGVCSLTGQILGHAIQAEHTVALAVAKPGLYLSPGKFQAGKITLADIGIPNAIVSQFPPEVRLITPEWAKEALPKHLPTSHKGTRGHVMVIGGSSTMPGAPQLSAMAALTSGCGLVTLAMPESAYERVGTLWPEFLHAPWPDFLQEGDPVNAWTFLRQSLDERPVQALVLGPGLGRLAPSLMSHLLPDLTSRPLTALVLDADALNALANLKECDPLPAHVVLTPHVGEAARLLQCSTQEILADLTTAARNLQARWGGMIVLKSSTTVIALSSGDVIVNPSGCAALATAGSGDVLCGMITSLAAQGCPADHAAMLGAYLHGLAGERAAQGHQGHGVIASMIIECLPAALADINQK